MNVDFDLMCGGCTGCIIHSHTIYNISVGVGSSYSKCVSAPALLTCRKRSPRDPLLENCTRAVVTMLWQSCVLHFKAVVEHEIQIEFNNSSGMIIIIFNTYINVNVVHTTSNDNITSLVASISKIICIILKIVIVIQSILVAQRDMCNVSIKVNQLPCQR